MKMITAIVNKDDGADVCRALTEAGYMFTKISTSGGFLRSGNITLLMGTEDEKVEHAVQLIREHCARRKAKVPAAIYNEYSLYNAFYTAEVEVGGATVFISNVEQFEKM